ncbi:MAG TPA: hypothetical protein PLO53_12365 [Candidatus Hydrogenedentes bacterium]|nr:hypothetical protein [Candidatus Hydrogenedentota bacterium]HPU98730.1 hypothetical protein [Candidatus Hydrogenedentota bacterium]
MITGLLISMAAILEAALPENGQVAFIAGEEQKKRIITVYDFSTRQFRKVGAGTHNGAPSWSPDGQVLAFTGRIDDRYGVITVNADGSNPRMADLDFEVLDDMPRWSADGKKLAFSVSLGGEPPRFGIAVWDLATNETALWGGDAFPSLRAPVWMPSTDLLMALDVQTQQDDISDKLFALREDAEKHGVLLALAWFPGKQYTEPVLVTLSVALPLLYVAKAPSDRSAEWMLLPDHKGRQIAFESDMGGDREIYVLGKRGVVNATNHPAADWFPKWSPNDRMLAFESFRDGRRGVYLSVVETARVSPVAVSASWDCWSPDWSPDGKWLVYVSNRNGKPDLWITDQDGGHAEAIPADSWALAPAWRPKGN